MPVAAELAKRIVAMRYEDLPADAVHWAKVALIDTVGCTLAGVPEEATLIAERVMGGGTAQGECLLWGTRRRARALDAVSVNGTASHALDYDDVGNSIGGHPSAPIIPAVIALGEMLHLSGREVLTAFVTGFEVEARIGHAVNVHHYEKGWHPTATLGVFGATAGAARLLGLTAEQTAMALSIAVSLSSGVKANFGTMTKPLHVGVCGRNGLYAAMLAREGFTAHPEAFEHHQGFFELFNGAGNYDAAKAVANWANPLDILSPGMGLKQYPCCASTHSAIDAMIILKQKYGLTPDNVAKIETVTHERALVHTNRPQPNSTLDAKFSVQYCVARALLDGDVKFQHFEGDTYRDPAVRKLLDRVTASTHTHKAKGMRDHYEGKVRVTTADGRTLEAGVELPLRGPTNLAPPDRLLAKFNDCAARVLRPDGSERVLGLLQRFETLDDTRQLTDAMSEAVAAESAQRAAA